MAIKSDTATDPLSARQRRGVRITVGVVIAVAVLIYAGVLTGVIAL
jgi:hypothetical protein